jgi:hypothetical protein
MLFSFFLLFIIFRDPFGTPYMHLFFFFGLDMHLFLPLKKTNVFFLVQTKSTNVIIVPVLICNNAYILLNIFLNQ